tara:strand:- start:549 stop:1361 length:813 start_codon:yes stop_codon:yes gene_type:complete
MVSVSPENGEQKMKIRSLPIRRLKAPREKGGEGIVLSYTASTAAVDRYGDVIDQKGWNLDSYRGNPVVLWQHRSDLAPIGKGTVKIHNDSLLIDVEFDTDDFSAEIARKAQAGFINAVSVGFNPLQSVPRSDLPAEHFAYGEKGYFFESSELLEVSMVSIPANGDAIAAKSLGLAETIASVSKHILEIRDEEDRIVIHFAKSEREETIEEDEEEEIIEESAPVGEGYGSDDEDDEDKEEERNFAPLGRIDWGDKEDFVRELIKLGDSAAT